MNAIVDPHGPDLVNLPSNPMPEGGRAGYFQTYDNVRLRYAIWPKSAEHRGTICLVQGRTEFIEKYFETIADFRARGFAVATFDWRGQGGSERMTGNPSWAMSIGSTITGAISRAFMARSCCPTVRRRSISSAIRWAGWRRCLLPRMTG
jgi:pimeloyl-ACP methyl ester carboxylesterase